MEADSTQYSSGSSVPIRAPLTIDSDSGYNYSRSNSFNSCSSSIDLSSYGDDKSSVLEEHNNDFFEAYPDDEIVLESSNVEQYAFSRAFVKYPDGNCVKESSSFDKNDIFTPFVKYPDENFVKESGSFDKNVVFRRYVKYPDGNCVKESSSCDKNVIFTPSVKYPDEDCVKESGSFDKNLVFKPFVKYPEEDFEKESGNLDKNVVFRRRFANYPDGDHVKESGDFDKDVDFRPFVKYPCEESSSGDFGSKLGVPVAHLTSDCDSETESDSDGIVQKIGMAPKAKIFSGDEGDDEGDDEEEDELLVKGVCSGDDVNGIEELKSVLAESIEDEGCGFESLNEVVGFSESDELSVELERIDGHIVSNSISEIEIETISVKLPESDELNCDLERIDAQTVSSSDNEIEIETFSVKLPESVELSYDLERIDAQNVSNTDNEIEIETINMKLPESDELSSDLERIDEHIVSSSNNEIEIETINVKLLPESDELSFREKVDSQIVSDSINEKEIENINAKHSESDELSFREKVDPQIISDSDNEIEIEPMNMKLSGSDYSSWDLEIIDAHISPNSENEIAIETICENKQEVVFDCFGNESKKQLRGKEEESHVKMQTRENFVRFALGKQLTTKVNGKDEFDFHLTILVIGKTGAGKSATINSIFGENKTLTNAFNSGTTTIQEIIGNVDGIQLRVLDTPGLKCSPSERSYNLRILKSIKRFTRKHTPNVVLYVDRLDTYTQDVNDSQLLRLITSSLGSSMWSNCIIALTHAASNPPDESSGEFMSQRCCFLQEQIVSVRGTNRHMVNPVWLVENHPSYQKDRSKLFELSGLEGSSCFDLSNEDECESLEVINGSVARKIAYLKDHGYRVKLLGYKHWSIACRLYS